MAVSPHMIKSKNAFSIVRVNWTDPALHALDGVFEYISRDAPVYAQNFVQRLMAAVDHLEQHPLSGRIVPDLARDDIREIIYQHYRIIYWVSSDEQIDIISVVHGSRDLSQVSYAPWDGI